MGSLCGKNKQEENNGTRQEIVGKPKGGAGGNQTSDWPDKITKLPKTDENIANQDTLALYVRCICENEDNESGA